jgi:hypothetical protein
MADVPALTTSAEDGRALDLFKASGVLNPNLTLDKLMDVTRQLAELEPATDGGTEAAYHMFIHRFYCLRHQPWPTYARTAA